PMATSCYRNAQGYQIPEESVARLDHKWYTDNIAVYATACSPGCVAGCSGWYRIEGDESPGAKKYASEWGTKPEYGGLCPFGAGCDVRDLAVVSQLKERCNRYGMDTFEVGLVIAFLMELWERGIINENDIVDLTGVPLSLEWGNYEAIEKIIDEIALQRTRLGDILRKGVYNAAHTISELKGVDVLKYANYGKAGATHENSVKTWPALAMACAVASVGASHLKGLGLNNPETAKRYLGQPTAMEMLSTEMKGPGHAVSENLMAVTNSLGLCIFLANEPSRVSHELLCRGLYAAMGVQLTPEELYTAGERVVNIQKAFNSRLGYMRKDDTLCHRWMNEPQIEGLAKGIKAVDYLESMKDEYYEWHGWAKDTSLQTRGKLAELDLMDVAEVLEKENVIA
ncbi:aldehyde ferredoxin oxidoreductase C-terminal domain-containing protein, partial [Chloroflexota bacterium]